MVCPFVRFKIIADGSQSQTSTYALAMSGTRRRRDTPYDIGKLISLFTCNRCIESFTPSTEGARVLPRYGVFPGHYLTHCDITL